MTDIDPDGPDSLEPVRVYCDMISQNGTGVTVIGRFTADTTEN